MQICRVLGIAGVPCWEDRASASYTTFRSAATIGFRVFPSYIMTDSNILIEKSKCEMIADDIRRMMALIADGQ